MIARAALAALAVSTLAGCSAEMDREPDIRAPQIRVVGDAQQCVQLRQIEQTVVHDDYTIDFEMTGGRTFRNTLPDRCYSLGFQRSFAYDVTTAQLCAVDTITVLLTDNRRGTSCRLGRFLPVELIGQES